MDKSTLDTLKLRDMMTVPELPFPMEIAEREQAPLDPKGRLLPTGRKNE